MLHAVPPVASTVMLLVRAACIEWERGFAGWGLADFQYGCKSDVESYCKEVPAEAVHDCLQKNEVNLSSRCRVERVKMLAAQAEDVRLNPKIKAACSQPIDTHCKEVRMTQVGLGLPGWGSG